METENGWCKFSENFLQKVCLRKNIQAKNNQNMKLSMGDTGIFEDNLELMVNLNKK